MNEQLNKHGVPITCENCKNWIAIKANNPICCGKQCLTEGYNKDEFEPSYKALEARIEELQEEVVSLRVCAKTDALATAAYDTEFQRLKVERDKLKAFRDKFLMFCDGGRGVHFHDDDEREFEKIETGARALRDGKESK